MSQTGKGLEDNKSHREARLLGIEHGVYINGDENVLEVDSGDLWAAS